LQEKNLIIFFENAEIDIGMESVNIIFEYDQDFYEEIIEMMEKYSQMMFRLLYYGNLEKIGGMVYMEELRNLNLRLKEMNLDVLFLDME